MKELLFEVLSEELPSQMQHYGAHRLYSQIKQALDEAFGGNFYGEIFFTPRRIGFVINDIPKDLRVLSEKIKGPKTNAQQIAVDGFMRKYSIMHQDDLIEEDGCYYYITKEQMVYSSDFIKNVIEQSLSSFTWPQSMRWGGYQMKWIRPIISLLCIFDQNILPIKFGHYIAGNTTRGHLFLSKEEITVSSYQDYKEKLHKAFVILNQQQRMDLIKQNAIKECQKKGVFFKEDERLLKEVANLVEFPYVAVGSIERRFMSLPREVLVTTLRYHQKYLLTENKEKKLAPYFIIVSNIPSEDGMQTVIKGNEKVLRARLSDAEFFLTEDRKKKLIDRYKDLSRLSFHEAVGSYLTKVEKITEIAVKIASQLNLDMDLIKRAVKLIKADLMTETVKELPELQGILGYYNALFDGESEELAVGIKEHYLPEGPSDSVPSSIMGSVMALGDKISTLNMLFAANIKPTGSKDPFALRRAAIGVIRIVCENKLKLRLRDLINDDVKDFVLERVKSIKHDKKDTYNMDLSFIEDSLR